MHLGANGLVAAEPRAEYYSVYFVEPVEENYTALGFDLASNPARKAAMLGADRLGQPSAAESIELVQDDSSQRALLIFVPIYDDGRGIGSDTDRQLRGFTLGLFRIAALVDTALEEFLDPNLCLTIEGRSSEDRAAVYGLASHDALDSFSTTRTLDVAGRQWAFTCKPNPSYAGAHTSKLKQ